jgi:carbonic anhydrase
MSATDDLLDKNAAYAEERGPREMAAPPSLKVAVLACMDARLDPARILGIAEGEAHVIRNAGGVVTSDALRSLAISQHLLGTREVILMHHTDCGMMTFTDEEFSDRMDAETGQRPSWVAGSFRDLDGDVRESIRRIKENPFVPEKSHVRGFVFDVKTGLLREVHEDDGS